MTGVLVLPASELVAVVFSPDGEDTDVAHFDADAGGTVVLTDGGEESNHRVAGIAILVGHEAVDIVARLVGEEVAERIKDDGVATVGGAVGFDGLEHVGMMADDDGRSGIEHLVGEIHIVGTRSRGVFDAPVDGDDEEIALGAGGLDGSEDLGLVGTGGSARFAGIGEEVDVGLVGVIGVAIAVEPAGHAEPADLDAVGLGKDGLEGLRGGVAGAGEKEAGFAEMLAGFDETGPALVHDVVVGEGNDFDAAGLEGFGQDDGSVEHEGLRATGVGGGDGSLKVDEAKIGGLEDVADLGEERGPALDPFALSGSGGADGFVWNDVAGNGEADPGKLVRIGDDGLGGNGGRSGRRIRQGRAAAATTTAAGDEPEGDTAFARRQEAAEGRPMDRFGGVAVHGVERIQDTGIAASHNGRATATWQLFLARSFQAMNGSLIVWRLLGQKTGNLSRCAAGKDAGAQRIAFSGDRDYGRIRHQAGRMNVAVCRSRWQTAASADELRFSRFAHAGYHVFSVKARGSGVLGGRRKVKLERFLIFNQQFLTLIRAGLPILGSLNMLAKGQKDRNFAAQLDDVANRVKTGESLSAAFEAQSSIPAIYTTTLLAGERKRQPAGSIGAGYVSFQRVSLTFRKQN